MSEELARQIENDIKATSVVKLADRVLRDAELGDRCVCDCRDCNTCDVLHHVRDAAQVVCGVDYGTCTSVGACRSPITSARRRANLQHRNLRLGRSLHCSCTSKDVKNHKLQTPHLKIHLKVRNIAKQITKKYFQKIKRFISTKTKSRKCWFNTNRKINQLASLTENDPRRRKKYYVGKTAPSLGLPLANSVNVLKTSTVFRSVSSISTAIRMAHSRSGFEAHRNSSTNITAANLFSKLMLHLKLFFGVIMKLQTIKKFNVKKRTAYERPTVVLNYIFPYASNSSNTLDDINKMERGTQSSVINVISDVSSAPNSSMESFNDQEIQVSEHSTVQNLIANVEPFVKNIYTGNAYSQCILRSNEVLLQSRNKNAKRIIKKSRRVTFRGHHKRFMTKTYGQNFNKMYHTFLAEVSYTNQPLQSGQNEQGVGIGSTWDINIDFGKSQDFPVQPCVEPGSDTIKKQTPDGALDRCLSKTSDLQPYQCLPGACDKNECCKGVRRSAPYGSHASTQSCKSGLRDQRTTRECAHGKNKANTKKARNIRKGREKLLAGNQIASAPAGLPCRQAVRIGSKSRFKIQLYKQTPLGARTAAECNKRRTSRQMKQCDTTVRRKSGRTRDKKRPLKLLPCEPGICEPHKCDLSDCYRRQKGSVTETSRSCSSQVSSEIRGLKGRQLRGGKEMLCKEKGTSSKPRPKTQLNMPNRQAVRIGSKCSFNMEYYKSMSENASAMSTQDPCDTTSRRKTGKSRKKRKPLPCEPVICVPDNCDLSDCYRRQKSSVTETSGSCSSQVSTQTRGLKDRQLRTGRKMLCKEKGTSSKPRPKAQLNMPNRQAVRIGSKCSFNVEFYKSMPQNALAMCIQDPCDTTVPRKDNRIRKKERRLEMLPCQPIICVPDKCDPSDCYRRQKSSVTETSGSCSSQVSTQTRRLKGRQLRKGRAMLCKEIGTSSKPRPKAQLNMPNRQAVRIGSKCSFNIEFYKSMPQNALAMCIQDPCDTTVPRKSGGTRKKMSSLEMLPCEPVKCVPDKSDLSDCYRRQKSSVTETSGSCSSQVSTQTRGLKGRQLRGGKEMLCKEKGTSSKPRPKAQLNMPNRQAVRIGSKCSFNIEFYKSMPQNALAMCIQDPCDTTVPRKDNRIRKKERPLEMLPCQPIICVPDKCDPSDCYRRQKSSVTETSGSCSSQVSTQTRRLKGRQLRKGRAMLCKEIGTSSKPRPKAQLNMPNRQAVRIGSKCSFNIEFYKSMPQNALVMCTQDPCDTTVPRKDSGTKKKERPLEILPCEPGICVPDKCDPSDCYRRQKGSVTETSGSCSSQVSTQTRGLKGRQLRTGKEMLCKEKGTSSKPRPKAQLNMPNRQAVRIGSKCSFNIEFYKSMPQNALAMCTQDPCDTTVPRKADRIRKKERPLEILPCEPGICVPDKCDPSDCYRRQKSSVTETSGSCSSQVSTQTRGVKGRQLRTGREMLCKEMGTSSKPRSKAQLNMPNRQAVRIGSKCSFNIEFYKSLPLAMREQDRSDTSGGRKGTEKTDKVLKKYQCEPGVCTPGICNANECFQQLKTKQSTGSSKGTSQGSQTSTKIKKRQDLRAKSTFVKDKGLSSMPTFKGQLNKPNRQAVRIGSNCSFNIEFYKSSPQNALAMSGQDRGDTSGKGNEKKGKVVKEYQCEPGMCTPGKCNAKECFQQMKIKQSTGTDGTLTGSSKGTSQGSQTSTKTGKKRQDLRAKSTFYKDKSLSSMPRAKRQLNMPNREVVRIGSTCSFNIEFYKSLPQSALALSASDRSDASEKKGKGLKQYQCEPGVCAPGNCDANECFQLIKTRQSTGTDGSLTASSKGTSQGSQTSTKAGKKRQELRAKSSFYKDKGSSSMRLKKQSKVPKRKECRIGSKCSFNIEFYKSLPLNALAMRERNRGDTSDGRKGTEKKSKKIKEYQCEPGVCTPGKCNANECFEQIKNKKSTGTDGSLTGSSKGTSQGSQTSKKSQKKRQELRAKSTFYKDKGLSSKPRAKGKLNIPNREAVCIGSTCSFNIEFYKSFPQSALAMSESDRGSDGRKGTRKKEVINKYQCEPGVCEPGKCNANKCFKQIKMKQSTSRKKGVGLKQYQCEPGACVPGICDANECFQIIKIRQRTDTDSSLTGSSKGTSQGSQTSTKVGKKRQELRAKSTFFKDKGSSSMPPKKQSKVRKRKAVRIGSKCSFNIEFYRSMPQSALAMSERNQGDTSDARKSTRKKEEVMKKYQCEPGVCEPGKCNANKCFKQIKMKQSTAGKKGSGLKQYQCEPGVCAPGNCNANECFQIIKKKQKTSGKKGKLLKQYQCEPGVCAPGNCNANECFQLIKTKQSTGTDGSLTGNSKGTTSQGSQISGKAQKTRQELKLKSTFYKEKGSSSMPRPKASLNMPNRKAVRIGSTCSFNIEFYKSFPRNGSEMSEQAGTGKKGQALQKYQCEPGVCVPSKCNPNECFQILKSNYEASGFGSSLTGSSRGSQAYNYRYKNKTQVLKSGNVTLYKDKGVASKRDARKVSHKEITINRQPLHIGSDCSFNIEFYKSWSQNSQAMRSMREKADTRKKPKALSKYQCKPGLCVAGECNAKQCFQRLKTENETSGFDSSLTGSSLGSRIFTKRRKKILKSSTDGKPNRQAVRIGSMCSFNIDFYVGRRPQDTLVTKQQSSLNVPKKRQKRLSGKIKPRKNKNIFECKPNVCIPGKCNPVECLKQFECKPRVCVPGKCDPSDCIQRISGTEDSFTGSSMSTQSRKLKGLPRECDKTVYKEKGVSCIPGKPSLRSGNHQGVRIGSSCSFNIEFYKEMSHPEQNNQGDTGKKRRVTKKYECMPGICKPGKCNAVECYNRLKNSQSSTSGGKKFRKIRKVSNKYECEPGVCIPGKCNAKECFQIFKAKHNMDTDGSFTDSSLAASRASQVSKKRKRKQPGLRSGKATFLTERGASTMPRSKMLLHLQNRQAVRIGSTCSFNIEFYKAVPGYKRPRDVNVRPIQPPFQYNIDQTKQYPPQYYPSSSETSRDSTSTSLSDKKGKKKKEKVSGKKEKVSGMKEKIPGVKEKIPGVKEKISGKKEKISKKKEKPSVEKEKISGDAEKIPRKKGKIPGKKEKMSVKKEKSKAQQDQGDATVQKKSSSDMRVKKKEPKRKTTKEKPSSRKTEQGDATSTHKLATEKKVKPKEIRTKRKQSQTRVRDQQSDTQVNEKVGTGKLQSQGDTPVQRKEAKKIGKALTEKQKGKYDEGDKGFDKGNVSTSTVASPPSSDSVSVSKKTSVNLDRKKEAERRKAEASTLPVYKDMGMSHIAADKKGEVIQQRIPPLATPGSKKQVCRIGSSCSFNFQLYKDKPLSPDQVASIRSASPSTPEVKTEKNNMANYIRKCMCKFTGQRSIPCPNISGIASQTKQKFECVSGSCDYAKCEKNQCPARFNIDTGIGTDTCGRGKPPVACCTNAATQSRRCPGLQQLMRDPRAVTRLRNAPYPSIVPGNWPFGPIPGYGDNFNRCIVREQAVILGSGCGFNVNFFKKRNKKKK